MEREESANGISRQSVVALADELASRLRKEIGHEIEEALGQFQNVMEESPLKILNEADAKQDQVLRLLDDWLISSDAEDRIADPEIADLKERIETALEEKTAAEKRVEIALNEKVQAEEQIRIVLGEKAKVDGALARIEARAANESNELKATIERLRMERGEAKKEVELASAEKRTTEKNAEAAIIQTAEVKKKLSEAEVTNKTLEKRLSTRSVYRAAAVILLIIALLAIAYAIYNRQVDPVSVNLRSFNNRLKEITISIEQKGQLIEEFNRKQNQLITQFENLDEQVNSIGIKIANPVSEGQLENPTEELSRQVSQLDQTISQLQQDRAPLQQDLNSLRQVVNKLENSFLTRADTLTELSALEKKMAVLERKTSSLAGMDQEAAIIKKQVSALGKKVQRLSTMPVMVQGKKIEIYRISTELYFTSGGSEISEQGKARVKSLAEKIKSRPNVFIRVEGHTDDKLLRWTSVGRYVDNSGLSLARAAVVTRLLIETGLTPKRISTFGLGSSQPIVPNTSPENRSVNRRVEIIVTHNGG